MPPRFCRIPEAELLDHERGWKVQELAHEGVPSRNGKNRKLGIFASTPAAQLGYTLT